MAIALIDTNILIDYYDGVLEAKREFQYYTDTAISNVTYMEFVIGLRKQQGTGVITVQEFNNTLASLAYLPVIQIDANITQHAIDVRSNSLLGGAKAVKLPDAIIFATAAVAGRYMVTRDPRGFTGLNVRQPYQIGKNGVVHSVNPHPPV